MIARIKLQIKGIWYKPLEKDMRDLSYHKRKNCGIFALLRCEINWFSISKIDYMEDFGCMKSDFSLDLLALFIESLMKDVKSA